eukprot:3495227-Rhodomonas_salina.1
MPAAPPYTASQPLSLAAQQCRHGCKDQAPPQAILRLVAGCRECVSSSAKSDTRHSISVQIVRGILFVPSDCRVLKHAGEVTCDNTAARASQHGHSLLSASLFGTACHDTRPSRSSSQQFQP